MVLKKVIGSFITQTENYLKKGITKEANVRTIGIFTLKVENQSKLDTTKKEKWPIGGYFLTPKAELITNAN